MAAGGNIVTRFDTNGRAWTDEVIATDFHLEGGVEVPNHPHYDYGLPSSGTDFSSLAGRARMTEAERYWGSIPDTRVPYLRDQGRAINPDFRLFTNSSRQRRGGDYFMVEGQADGYQTYFQNHSYHPGTYPPGGVLRFAPVTAETVVTNILSYKLAEARRFPDEFSYVMHSAYGTGSTPVDYTDNGDTALLMLAEGTGFGGGAGIDLQYHNFYYDYDGVDDVNPPAPADALGEQGLLFDVAEEELTDAQLARVKVVVLEQTPRLSEAEAQRLVSFMERGGVVIAGGHPGDLDELGRLRAADETTTWPPVQWPSASGAVSVGAGKLWVEPGTDGLTPATLEAALAATLRASPGAFEPADPKLRISAWTTYDRTVVHVMNYAPLHGRQNGGQVPVRALTVKVALPPGQAPASARLSSPEHDEVTVPVTMLGDGRASFTIPAFHIYTVAELR